jgi:hypothetical protein
MKWLKSVGFLALVLGLFGCTVPTPEYQAIVVRCDMQRQECLKEGKDIEGNTVCTQWSDVFPFSATACADSGAGARTPSARCLERYCGHPLGVAYGYPSTCQVNNATDVTGPSLPNDGTCRTNFDNFGTHLALVTYSRNWRDCIPAQGGGYCTDLPPNDDGTTTCLDVSATRALDALQPRTETRDRRVQITALAIDWPNCPLRGDTTVPPMAYQMTPGDIGTATGGGTSTVMTLKSGFATTHTECDDGCTTFIDRLNVNLADRTIAGAQVSSVEVSNISPISTLNGQSLIRGVKLLVKGRVNGVDSTAVVENAAPWTFSTTATTFRFSGALDMNLSDANGNLFPVAIPVTLNGTPANAQTLACINLPPLKRLWGFEDPGNWRSSNSTLSLATSPVTQGCGGLGISGQNFIIINGSAFNTQGLPVNNALSIDLFIPNNQPNQFFLGNLQVMLSCPSGGVNNQFIGQVGLTGKPQNAFSTLRFPLPAQTITTFQRPLNDCFFTWGLNVNQTNRTWIMDNLRFTP